MKTKILLAALCLCIIPAHADNLFVGETGLSRIGVYSVTTGTAIQKSLITGLSEPCDIKFTPAGNLLVTCEGGTSRLGLYTAAGAALNATLTTMTANYQFFVSAVQVGTNIVAAVENSASIPAYGLAGNQVVTTNSTFISGVSKYPGSIVTDGTYYYVNDTLFGQLTKFSSSGSVVTYDLATGAEGQSVMTIDGTNLYLAYAAGFVAKYSTSGKVISTNLISGLNEPLSITADGRGHIFVGNYGNGTVGEYGTDGSVINPALITNLNGVLALAVQSTGPTLNISQSNNTVFVTWPALTNYFLQTNGNLNTTNWSLDTNVSDVNGTNTATVTPPKNALYFRLESTNGY